jgi:hypothetical protein
MYIFYLCNRFLLVDGFALLQKLEKTVDGTIFMSISIELLNSCLRKLTEASLIIPNKSRRILFIIINLFFIIRKVRTNYFLSHI